MHLRTVPAKRIAFFIVFTGACLLLSFVPVARGQFFEIDPAGYSGQQGVTSNFYGDDILNRYPLPGPPTIPGAAPAISPILDVDAFSFGLETQPDFLMAFDVFISVDRSSTGVVASAVFTEAAVNDQSADIYLRPAGSGGPPTLRLLFDGDGSSKDGLGLTENGLPSRDDVQGVDMSDQRGARTYFSISPPAVPLFGLGATAADVFWSPTSGFYDQPGAATYASALILGLQPTDDIDALAVYDGRTPGVYEPFIGDRVLFSLAPGSPTLALLGASPADILTHDGASVIILEEESALLLTTNDNINALDVRLPASPCIGFGAPDLWNQSYDSALGKSVPSWTEQGGPLTNYHLVADDLFYDGRPITRIMWWGSYAGWQTSVPTDVQWPTNENNHPIGFTIGWAYESESPTQEMVIVQQDFYPLASPAMMGEIQEDLAVTIPVPFMGSNVYEHHYHYLLQLTNGLKLGRPRSRYWVGIQAVYTNEPANPWGWSPSSLLEGWSYPAFYRNGSGASNQLFYPPALWGPVSGHPYETNKLDMSLSLGSCIGDSYAAEAHLPADTDVPGQDMASWFHVYDWWQSINRSKRADDYMSDGRTVRALHWWGTYPGWQTNTVGSLTNPVAPPVDGDAPLAFVVTWYTGNTSGSPQSATYTNYVPIDSVAEMFSGSITQAVPGTAEHLYEYGFDIADGTITPTNGEHVWISIEPLFPAGTTTAHNGWAWHFSSVSNASPAVLSTDGGGTWTNDVLKPPHPAAGTTFDHAFLVSTHAIATNQPVPLDITRVEPDIFGLGDSFSYLVTTGYQGAGTLELQSSTNLTSGAGWITDFTEDSPKPENTFQITPTNTTIFYRIRLLD